MKNILYTHRSITIVFALISLAFAALACSGPTERGDDSPTPTTNENNAVDTTQADEIPAEPMAQKRPKTLKKHGEERIDEYYWLRDDDREDPEVLDYLKAENRYLKERLDHTADLQNELFEEMKGRIKKDDASVPFFDDGYWYYKRFIEGGEYPIYCRRAGSMDNPEEVMLDGNAMAEDHDFFQIAAYEISDDNEIIAWAEDTVGRRQYVIRFKNLETGEVFDETIENTSGSFTWAADNETLFYVKRDPETLRSFQVFRHELGTRPDEDVLAYQEDDEAYYTSVFRTKSDKYVGISLWSTLTTEFRLLEADQPTGEFVPFLPREENHEHEIYHYKKHFYVVTNWEAKNFRLMKAPVATSADKSTWEEVVPGRDDAFLHSIEVFEGYLVLSEQIDALRKLRIMPLLDGGGIDEASEHYVEFEEPVYTTWISVNRQFDTDTLRFTYTSLTTPNSTWDYSMKEREMTLLKQDEVLGGFDKEDYRSERRWITARDGTKVPVSLVHHADTPLDGSAPLYVYAYGSYGYSMNPYFSGARLSLLDRGFVYAICHVRGGQEMGRQWYEDGKLLKKMNTFTDFIDCSRELAESGIVDPEHVFASGGSAGGLLMGAVINMAPEVYRGVVADVPFVDVVTTMLDDSIPLTTNEYDEWGNPNEKEYYDYMLSYSPYDNVTEQAYPNLLVMTGLHDSQVQYWEPAKWVARLRDKSTGDNLILMRTNMSAGHGGASGRFERYRETALMYAFFLDLSGTP